MDTANSFKEVLLAPCGINCRTCIAFLRPKNKCPGCLINWDDKQKSRVNCIIRNCTIRKSTETGFCYECKVFPCRRMKDLDKRYRSNYRSGLLENLYAIKESGIESFLEKESSRWSCPVCGAITSIHKNNCLVCNTSLEKATRSPFPSKNL